ncbi:MAG TPA: glucose 1-dehydrogenase [Caulobacteraceae bacterium]|jgi:3-oxoacyl-[acyl-carrier protein] reductase|nr:glucose 1-dehydrogenase [Caulobacteraceae bacterium]
MADGRLSGKRAIVTGGASGFGEGIVRRFVEEGARVAIADLAGERAQALAARLGAGCMAVECDVADEASVGRLFDEVEQAFGGLDIMVNNAGMGLPPAPLESMDPATFERLMAVNVRSVYLTSRRAVPLMKAQKAGAILHIASTGGVSPRPNLVWYNASKGWMIAAGRAMAAELAPAGVRVNIINPVAGDTPMLATFMGADTPEARARFVGSIPMGRLSTPADIAAAALYLCSDEASLVTGVALEVDGGRCL